MRIHHSLEKCLEEVREGYKQKGWRGALIGGALGAVAGGTTGAAGGIGRWHGGPNYGKLAYDAETGITHGAAGAAGGAVMGAALGHAVEHHRRERKERSDLTNALSRLTSSQKKPRKKKR